MTSREWFKQAKFGMMIHWGLYSLPAGEWRGERMDEIGEWCQQYFRIPNEEYHALAKAFNPILFDAEEWVKLAKEVGISNVNLTNIKTGKISAIRFSTLEAICDVLDCQPGDILEYKRDE